MHFRTNVSNSHNIVSYRFQITAITVFLHSINLYQSANAGLIEAAKDTACKVSSAKAVVDSGTSPANDASKNRVQAVTLFFKHACNTFNSSSGCCANFVDLSAFDGSKSLDITLGEFAVALINAHVYARLRISADNIDQNSLCFADDKIDSKADKNGLFSGPLKSDQGDYIRQFQIFNSEDNLVILHFRSPMANDLQGTLLQSRTAEFAMTFVAENSTTGRKLFAQASPHVGRKQELLDGEESDDESDEEAIGDKSFDDLTADEGHHLFEGVDSFDPLKASIAFLIFSAVALIVNVVPRRTALRTQL